MAKQKSRRPGKTQPAKQQSTGHNSQFTLTLSEVMQQAIAAYNGRDWAKAEKLCRLLLNARPDYFYALNLLGIIAAQTDRSQEAADLFERAVAAEPGNAQAHSNLGNALLKLKRFDEAVASYDRAISLKPDLAEAYSNRGHALKELKRLDDALASYDRAISIKPDYAEAYSNRGLTLQELKRFDDAIASYDRAISIKPDYAEAYNNRGFALQDLKRFEDALASYDRAISIKPDYAEAYYNRSNALRDLKRLEDAVASYDRAISIKPDSAEAYCNRGNALTDLKRLEHAVASYDRAISIKPDFAEAYYNRSNALRDLKRLEDAVASYDRAISIKPGYANAYNNRGLALKGLKRLEDAMASYDRAISIKPDFAEAYSNRGTALRELKRFDDAVASYDRAISIKPDYAEAYSNRGLALQDLKRFEAALVSHDRAISIKPGYAAAYWNKSLLLLSVGDFDKGWDLYEWRWETEKWGKKSSFAKDWDGAKVAGSLLVLPEQGIGDEIFYCGMLNDLLVHAESITVGVDPRLVKLYQRSFGNVTVVAKNTLNANHHFDGQVYMGSMGRYLRRNIGTLKNISPYYLRACPDQVQMLRAQIANGERLICGLSWVSKNAELGADKTIGLKDLQPILRLPNVDFVDLQYGDTKAEQAKLKAETGITLKHVEEIDNFNDIDGLASLITACDVVVTVSNTTAHLAAALGKPVFVMLPFSVGLLWYWHDGRDDSPWYPSAKLYRQGKIGDWDDALARVKRDLSVLRDA